MITEPDPRRYGRGGSSELAKLTRRLTEADEARRQLAARLAEAEETLEAIRSGSVDAIVVRGPHGDEVYTLTNADRTFRELAERMSDGAATVAEDGTILWANAQFAVLAGRPLERLVGGSIEDLVPAAGGEAVCTLLDGGREHEQTGEVQVARADGTLTWVRLSVTPVSIGGVASRAIVASDLTERRRTEALLRRSAAELEQRVAERTAELAASRRELEAAEDRLRMLLEAVAAQLPIGLIVAEPGGRIVFYNQEAERISRGVPVADWLQSRAQLTDSGSDSPSPPELALRRALAGEHVADTEVALAPEQASRSITALVRADPIRDEQGVVVAAVCAIVDITARREAEAIRDAFIDVTAHELKTPLTTLYGAVQTLIAPGRHLSLPTRLELLTDAAAETERLVHLVDDMLVLSRVERGVKFVLDEPMLLDHVVREIMESEARRTGTKIARLRIEGRPLPVVRGERPYVEQIVTNLLRNAAKYGRPPIEVVVETVSDGVAVKVLDNGPGFTSEPDALFELFYRERAAKAQASGGGIGLFVCRQLANMMGGRTWASNRPEGGAEFGFVLPAYGDDQREEPEPTGSTPRP